MADMYFSDAGFIDLMSVYFQGVTAPSAFKMQLVNDTVVATDNWADVSANEKASQGGYTVGGETINRDATASGWPTGPVLTDSKIVLTGKKCSWTANADWATAVTAVCIVADKATDQLVGYSNITSITPKNGDIVAWTPI